MEAPKDNRHRDRPRQRLKPTDPVSPARMPFGSTIRWLREARHVGLRDLARLTALSPSYLSRIERDRVPPPSAECVVRIAKALRTDTDDLLATAGFLPQRVLAFIRLRPESIRRIVSLVEQMTDDQVDKMCDEWQRRVGEPPSSTSLGSKS